jgi:hypothetical protein
MKELRIEIIRDYVNIKTKNGIKTFGKIFIHDSGYSGLSSFVTEEQEVREDEDIRFNANERIPLHTAVPCGTYEVQVERSKKFNRWVAFIKNVPYFGDIRFYGASDEEDIDSCIKVGANLVRDKSSLPKGVTGGKDCIRLLLHTTLGRNGKGGWVANYDKCFLTISNAKRAFYGDEQ